MTRKDFADMTEDLGNDYAFEELMFSDSHVKFVADLGDRFGE